MICLCWTLVSRGNFPIQIHLSEEQTQHPPAPWSAPSASSNLGPGNTPTTWFSTSTMRLLSVAICQVQEQIGCFNLKHIIGKHIKGTDTTSSTTNQQDVKNKSSSLAMYIFVMLKRLQMGVSIINHPFWGTPIFGNTQITMFSNSNNVCKRSSQIHLGKFDHSTG